MSADALVQTCKQLGLQASPEQIALLLKYLDELERWNRTYNLTALRDRGAMLSQHLADCLAILPPLQRHAGSARLLDVGSGGGLPGVVIAIMLPTYEVTCVDAVAKKVAFVRHVSAALALPNLHAVHRRAELMDGAAFDIVASRAFASLAAFVQLTQQSLATQGVWLAMKGKRPDDEITQVPRSVEVFHVEPLAVPGLDASRCLVWMRPAVA